MAMALVLGVSSVSAASVVDTGGTGLGRAATAQRQCPPGSVPADAADGTPTPFCEQLGKPESFGDMAARDGQMLARAAAPFNQVAPGAYQAGLAQAGAVAAAVTVPGSGAAWAPYGTAPLCDGHTNFSTLCPLRDNTNAVGLSNGDYTIALLGHKTLSGRISSFGYDPSTPGRVFASPTAGGVFESLDGGTTWRSIGDSLPTQVIGAIAYDAATGTLLAGSGDNSFGGTGISGHGLFYSADDGASWNTATGIPDLALSFRVVVSPADPTGRTVYTATSKGLFRSTDAGHSFVNLMLPTGAIGHTAYTVPDPPTATSPQVSCTGNTTAPLCFFANIATDVVVKGASPSANAPAGAVMAVLGWRAGQRIDTDAQGNMLAICKLGGVAGSNCVQAPRDGIYVSPYVGDATGACTFTSGALTKITNQNPGDPGTFCYEDQTSLSVPLVPGGNGFAANPVVGRTSLGIAHGAGQNNDAVYALVQDATKFQGCVDVLDSGLKGACNSTAVALALATYLDGMYASYDFGKTWIKVMDYTQTKYPGTNSALVGLVGYSPGVQSWYNNWVEPDPSTSDSSGNPTRVLFGLEEIWENNVSLGASVLNPALPAPLNGGVPGVQNPWNVVGRYWNACLGYLAGTQCNSLNLHSGSTTHPDQHAALFIPDSTGVTLFAGNDGGAYKQHVASGSDFSNDNWADGINTGLYSLQPYDASISKDGTVVAGLQDNGEEKIAPTGENHTIFGGDGFFTTIDPNNSKNIVEEYTYGVSSVTLDGGNNWYNIDPGCGSSSALFSTPIEEDPTIPGHVIEGCTNIQEAGGPANPNSSTVYQNPCAVPPGADPFTCQLSSPPWTSTFNLGTAPSGASNRIPSAVGLRGANVYVGWCGYCDVVTGGLPFDSGIATNVGGSQPPAIGTTNGWHFPTANCAGCGTANGKLPKRYINSVQQDPADGRTVYVTLGGYGRRWIPPGALGDSVSNVGSGHVFVSHDAGENFTDITGNLPDVSANYTLVRNGQLLVATDLGVYVAPTTAGGTWSHFGTALPNVPVFTIRQAPGNPDLLVAATFGRGVWKYNFAVSAAGNTPTPTPTVAGPGGPSALPNTAAGELPAALPVVALAGTLAMLRWRRRRRRRLTGLEVRGDRGAPA